MATREQYESVLAQAKAYEDARTCVRHAIAHAGECELLRDALRVCEQGLLVAMGQLNDVNVPVMWRPSGELNDNKAIIASTTPDYVAPEEVEYEPRDPNEPRKKRPYCGNCDSGSVTKLAKNKWRCASCGSVGKVEWRTPVFKSDIDQQLAEIDDTRALVRRNFVTGQMWLDSMRYIMESMNDDLARLEAAEMCYAFASEYLAAFEYRDLDTQLLRARQKVEFKWGAICGERAAQDKRRYTLKPALAAAPQPLRKVPREVGMLKAIRRLGGSK